MLNRTVNARGTYANARKISIFVGTKQPNTNKVMKAGHLLAFIGGAVVGAACGILYAPQKGTDLREKIAEILRKRGISLSKKEMSALASEIAEEMQSNATLDE